MNFSQSIKKIPFIAKKITQLKGIGYKDLFLNINNHDPIVIDIGANRGQTIDLFLEIYNKADIYAFEPTPSLYNDLQNRYKSLKNVFLSNYALGDNERITDFNISSYSPTNSILEPNISVYKNNDHKLASGDMLSDVFINTSKSVSVEVITFDKFYKENINGKVIDIFKTDTQGFDYEVLLGSKTSLPYIKSVLCECQFREFYKGSKPFYKTIEFLYDNGFYISNFLKNNYKERIFECDMLFINSRYDK